jgi:hypothetical protein
VDGLAEHVAEAVIGPRQAPLWPGRVGLHEPVEGVVLVADFLAARVGGRSSAVIESRLIALSNEARILSELVITLYADNDCITQFLDRLRIKLTKHAVGLFDYCN